MAFRLTDIPSSTDSSTHVTARGPTASCGRATGVGCTPVVHALPPSAALVKLKGALRYHHADGPAVRAALLDLVTQLGHLLRHRGQAARGLTLTLRFSGDASWEKSRRLSSPSGHDDDLRTLAHRLLDGAGLQRGRLTGLG